MNAENKKTGKDLKSIQRKLFVTQLVLIVTLALFLCGAGITINIFFENAKRDRNLENVAETIAMSPIIRKGISSENGEMTREYLDSLRDALEDIDVVSIVATDNVRVYHSNHDLIGTPYDGTVPEFEKGTKDYYAANDSGPSGNQRRAYAAIYDDKGNFAGFVITIMLMAKIREQTVQMLLIFFVITLAAIFMEMFLSHEMSRKIKQSLLGYEPNVFSAMYKIRDNILESLAEGIVAIDDEGVIQFVNKSAERMLGIEDDTVNKPLESVCGINWLKRTLESGEKEYNIREKGVGNADILTDRVPVMENGEIIGAVGILHDKAEYTKLMEDLTGTRYLVDSMRANNHDFTNKLHVILGLIQMQMYDEAVNYIENITIVQRKTISEIMKAVNEPAVAALLIGKTARASELNVKFVLREGCFYSNADMNLPSEMLVTVIGNLIDNAFDAMNAEKEYDGEKELLFGIFSRPGAVLITVDDTGGGIDAEDTEKIFENGYSTKGTGRGTGLYQVKTMVEAFGGSVRIESQKNVGASFTVSFTKKENER